MRYSLFLFFLIVVNAQLITGQPVSSFHQEIRFVNHLLSRGSYNEASFVLETIIPENRFQEDSLNYLTGWVLYSLKDLDASVFYLRKVNPDSPFYKKSTFFAAYNLAYLNQIDSSRIFLNRFSESESNTIRAMENFQRAGISLLDRQLDDYRNYSSSFNGAFGVMSREEEKFNEYYERIKSQPKRSPVVAGLMSAALPGLGKLYAGKPAEAISGFLYVGAMMATTYDFYNRQGLKSPLFIISAGLTSIFYIGNIWGSAIAVNRTKQEFNYEIDQRILLDMHIPLRNLFP
jgi:TM2 domain-containing membrane protein YozV